MKSLSDYLYYEEKAPDLKIYCGDCIEIMPFLPSVDLIVTDPPYGVGYADWDKELVDFKWLELARSKSEIVMVFCGNRNQFKYPPAQWMACWGRPGSIQRADGGGFSHWEPIIIYGKNPLQIDYRVFNPQTEASQWGHECAKPLKVVLWLVGASKPAETILDPFLGSGTTLVACKELTRNGIGIEINEKYCEIAKKRLKATCKPLFTDVNGAPQNSQSEMSLFAMPLNAESNSK